MASGLFFDPVVALRVAPLVSSTCSILFAHDQRFFLSILNKADAQDNSRSLLPSYYREFFEEALGIAMVCTATTTWSCITKLYVMRRTLFARGCGFWYMVGAALAAGRMLQAYSPRVEHQTVGIREDRPHEVKDVNLALDECRWLLANWLQGVTVDWAAWVAVFIAVCKALHA